MTHVDVIEAIAQKIVALWPDRTLYRDFCPVNFDRPSGFLYMQEAGFADVNAGLVQWKMQAELMLFASTKDYSEESTEQLRADQAAVLSQFGGPGLPVGDRNVIVYAMADAPGPVEAYVTFTASWYDTRPGYVDAEAEPGEGSPGTPMMEQFTLNVNNRKDE